MNNDGGIPPQPVTAALEAASAFTEKARPGDQIGVVTFATDALLSIPLSNQHTTTAQTIAAFEISPQDETGFTNTGAALKAAATELSSVRHDPDARRVLILLTDGLPTAPGNETDPVTEAITSAREIKESGVSIYAIGLGQGVNRDFISSLASDSSQAFLAPSRTDLSDIYDTITTSLCESGTARIDVIAKTATNFTPLR